MAVGVVCLLVSLPCRPKPEEYVGGGECDRKRMWGGVLGKPDKGTKNITAIQKKPLTPTLFGLGALGKLTVILRFLGGEF